MSHLPSSILHPHVLVTGGSGFIGSHLVERLLADGKRVVVLDDLSTGNRDNLKAIIANPNLRVIAGKISNCSELPELVRNAESIFHLAAAVGVDLVVKSPIHVLETNLHETEVLLKAAATHRVPILIASTSEVYGKSEKPAFSEDDDLLIGPPQHSRWGYACSKLMDEFLALAYAKERDLPVVIVRLFNTVGPRQVGHYGMVIPRFVEQALRGAPITVYGDGSQRRCFCHVADSTAALLGLADSVEAEGRVFNVGAQREISMTDLARTICERVGSRSELTFIPYDEAYEFGFEDMERRVPDTDRVNGLLGWTPERTLEQIIDDVATDVRSRLKL